MAFSVYAFDVDDCMESGGQNRRPIPATGPVTWQSLRQLAGAGNIVGLCGNWVGVPQVVPDWRDFLSFMEPPNPGNTGKGKRLKMLAALYPGAARYVMVGNDPANLPKYWSNYPPFNPIGGDSGISNDIAAARKAGWQFIKEDDFAAGKRTGQVPKEGKPYMQYKSARPEVLQLDADSGIVEAIVSVTGNKDYQNDTIMPGAYAKALADVKQSKIVFQHDWDFPLGKTISAVELMPGDKRLPEPLLKAGFGGLLVKGQFTMEDPRAAAIFAHLKAGSLDEFSIGFDVEDESYDEKSGTRYLKSIYPLYEWSPVLYGANPATMPLAVKSAAPARNITPRVPVLPLTEVALGMLAVRAALQRKRSA